MTFDVKPLVFYLSIAIGFAFFALGLVLTPGWWKLAWVAGSLGLLMVLPSILGAILDPLNVVRIHSYCRRIGVTGVKVEAFPNHYGVHFWKNDREHYAKCQVKAWQIKWKGLSPAEIQ